MVSITTTVGDILPTTSATSLALIAILTLATLLIQKEAVSGLSTPRAQRWSRTLDIALLPLALVFVLTLIVKLVAIWS